MWTELNGEKTLITNGKDKDGNPIYIQPEQQKLGRTAYLYDINSSSWQIVSGPKGLTLRIEFETDGEEIKRWRKRRGAIKRLRDKAAADGHITAPKGHDLPFIEIDINKINFNNGRASLEPITKDNLRVGMNFDGNGFIEVLGFLGKIFTLGKEPENSLTQSLQGTVTKVLLENSEIVLSSLPSIADDLLGDISSQLGTSLDVSDLRFEEDQAIISLSDPQNPSAKRTFSQITHILKADKTDLFLIEENSIDGSGNNRANQIVGNDADNTLRGKAGNDYISGNSGDDRIFGNSGDDQLLGGSGNDQINGGSGKDWIQGSYGNDRINGGSGDDVIIGNSGRDVLKGSTGNDSSGGFGDDKIYGGSGDDILSGSFDNDLIDGGSGIDVMSGGFGNDRYVVDNVDDVVKEHNDRGRDKVTSSVDYVLGDNVEELKLSQDAYRGVGNELDNSLVGSKLNNRLYGKAGNDYLDGYFGDDFLYGGDGDDVLVGTLGKDRLIGEAGNDKLDAGLFSNIQGINPLYPSTVESRYLDGGVGDDKLYGGLGNDNLRGGSGDDAMFGWKGDDVYHVDSAGDNVNESMNSGVDTVFASVNYTLSNHVETLVLRDLVYQGTGNSFDNTIRGNSSNNLIEGLAGDDDLDSYYGNDVLKGGDGNDDLNGGYGNDSLFGDAGNDKLAGNNGNDFLTGGLGDDLLLGGAGKDTFSFNSALEGLDTITDFNQSEKDIIQIVNSGFSGRLLKGAIDSNQFVLGTSSVNADSRFIYDQSTGSLLFDSDGTGAVTATQIAALSNNTNLTYSDIVIV